MNRVWKIAADGKVDDQTKIKACESLGKLAAQLTRAKPMTVALPMNAAIARLGELASD